ncbi:unnamed protein product [Lepeophtheirus salmonis]|uniref:(salmon louse) hypothetical protein n=1 Tax=Lepeophtheirus salmonis TaxID=72036 RepID=A0A7R8H5Q9_LEPSM|nr:unnamed protein product [Lepeophtheirus salmonis]CAF2867956.1 unnamed protein product [Lepeophtheirus salmonis]
MCCSRRRSSREDDSSRKCCKGKACCCCCCSKRGATICFSHHWTNYGLRRDCSSRKYLSQINGDNGNQVVIFSESNKDNLTNLTSPRIEDPTDDVHFASREKYKLAIFQLLDDTEEQVQLLAFFFFLCWLSQHFGESPTYLIPDFQNFAGVDPQLTQPLLPQERSSHPGGYHLGQYPQYYPPNGGSGGGVTSRQLPSAPPPSSTHVIYPSLANA